MTNTPSIEVVEETGSTNADLLDRLRSGETLREGYWLRADRQTSGRGRLARHWESPKGNLHCSTVVNLGVSGPAPATLSFAASLAVFDAVKRCLFDHTPMMLKWPNDLMVSEAKIAGILLERYGNSVVVGIGINVSHAPDIPNRKTTHIAFENGKFANGPQSVLETLVPEFAKRLKQWRECPLSEVLLDWAFRGHRFNDRLTVTTSDGKATYGAYCGITGDGGLRFKPLGGHECVIHAGDVSLLWEDEEVET
ncbi:biotin--[acetyl-CoA-carboxylase] ligase [Erythrobacter sp. MTPC3]|uniref:biotin--[acetyl-CoA-carboxylase] ligase n=1 Tax=Erythrobacter sp. MTPC3 TaxID=3056564 RepID=UPI0036F1FEE3